MYPSSGKDFIFEDIKKINIFLRNQNEAKSIFFTRRA